VVYLLRDGALEKRLARYGVVAIIFERIAHGLGRDRGAGEVKDPPDLMVAQEFSDKRLVFHATLDEGRTRIDSPAKSSDKTIQDHNSELGV
jgi:hypothetical protein